MSPSFASRILVYSVLLCFIAYWFSPNETVDIQLHDTYYVIELFQAMIPITGVLGLFALCYWTLRNRALHPWLTGIHTLGTLVIAFLLISDMTVSPGFWSEHRGIRKLLRKTVPYFFVFGLLAQILFIVNGVLALRTSASR